MSAIVSQIGDIKMLGSYPNIKIVNFQGCVSISGQKRKCQLSSSSPCQNNFWNLPGAIWVLSKCPSVETVIFNECKEITGKQIFR
jgi:hypothetical protein